MTVRSTPNLGPALDTTYPAMPFWDSQLQAIGNVTDASYRLGNIEMGVDGGEYMFVRASAAIAPTATTGTQVLLTYTPAVAPALGAQNNNTPTVTAATGAGGWFTFPNRTIVAGDFIHVRRGAFNALPA